jgi:hypothetical protein
VRFGDVVQANSLGDLEISFQMIYHDTPRKTSPCRFSCWPRYHGDGDLWGYTSALPFRCLIRRMRGMTTGHLQSVMIASVEVRSVGGHGLVYTPSRPESGSRRAKPQGECFWGIRSARLTSLVSVVGSDNRTLDLRVVEHQVNDVIGCT